MSDTPQSDLQRVEAEIGEAVFTESGCAADVVNADFARLLAGELAALRHDIARQVQTNTDLVQELEAVKKERDLALQERDVAWKDTATLNDAKTAAESSRDRAMDPSSIESIQHILVFHGEGAGVFFAGDWADCRRQFFELTIGDDWQEHTDEVDAWDAGFANDDEWTLDEQHHRFCFYSPVGEISNVQIIKRYP